MKNNLIKSRIFLVGCPRSGTTLLQSLLAAHPDIASFPESKFFQELVYPGSRRSKLKLASQNARKTFEHFLDDIEHKEMKYLLPKNAVFNYQYTKAFVRILDTLAAREDKHFWLEKTPSHLQRINYIEQGVKKAKFIHIIRNGKDVVASLYETTNKYPEIWGGSRTIERCIERWINDVNISYSHIHKPNHLLVNYEHLVEQTQLVLTEICQFLEIKFSKTMIQNYAVSARGLIRKHESWKNSVSQKIHQEKSSKFYTIFDEAQRKYIKQQVMVINPENIKANKTRVITDCQVF
ncbi:MAG: sulfotransferase [Pleurocapsa sp.]